MASRMFAATRKGLMEYRRNGTNWDHARTHFIGDPVANLLVDDRDDALYAALDLGHFGVKLHRSRDGGESWQELDPPKYPKGGDGAPSLVLLWTMAAGGPDQPGRLWAGTLPGGLFRSDDHGETWSMVESLWNMPDREKWFGGGTDVPGLHSICVDPRDSRRIAIAVSCGGTWVSEDDGESWRVCSHGMWAEYVPPEAKFDPVTQDPHIMVQCAAAPDVYWVQHHNGIFRCGDNLESWQEVTGVPVSNFGFAVAVHPHDPNTAWFAPALDDAARYPVDGKVVVMRTKDGGKSFDVIREGLPQNQAYDLVYRHGLAVDDTGNELLMGSTTGSLWFTADGADSWTLVNAHLPPVYAVKFG
ncbi:MAG: exo-alpha-sialidase [Alphaproteobacteria bacterium]|nr:exo-alpha-sialidase [Alphaproteobacteria bacterium]